MIARFADLVRDPFALADGPPPQSLIPFMRWALSGMGPLVAVTTLFGLLVGISESVGAWLIGWIVDFALEEGPEGFFTGNTLVLLACAAFFMAVRPTLMFFSSALNSLGLVTNIYALALTRLNRHTMGQSMRFFDDDFAGRISQKQLQTARALTDIVHETANAVVFAVAVVIGAVFVVGEINGTLALILLGWMVIWAGLLVYFIPRVRARAKDRAASRAVLTGQLVDTLTNISTVKLFAHVGREERSAEEATADFRRKAIAFAVEMVLFRSVLMFLAGALPVLLIGTSLWLWQGGIATPGEIATAGLISTRIAQMSGWVSFVAMGVFADVGEIEDGMRTLAPQHELTDRPTAADIDRAEGRVSYDAATFVYGREDGGGVRDLTLSIAPGEKVALVGRSGAGKSTALSMLLRLYDIEGGSVRLDGHDVRDLTQDSLRRQIAMVRQDTAMFNRSAYDNIAYGRPEASREEVFAAARQAEADGFITALRDKKGRTGYDAHLGERGVKLSGGQRQRIALARAILKDAPVLALDEATAALDSETEAAVQSALERLMQGRTVIAIAHRLSTIAHMDRIVVMEDGRIAELGTHDSLLAAGGLYAGFWARQSGGFLRTEPVETTEAAE
ncbi:MAG: ABC transporter ATP-binding protein [Pseudomonadota bacterium]